MPGTIATPAYVDFGEVSSGGEEASPDKDTAPGPGVDQSADGG